jgi:hypothetical protein
MAFATDLGAVRTVNAASIINYFLSITYMDLAWPSPFSNINAIAAGAPASANRRGARELIG